MLSKNRLLEEPLSGELKMTSFVYHGGKWTEGDPPLFTAMSHAVWLSSVVFDGARAFEGVTPDLDLPLRADNKFLPRFRDDANGYEERNDRTRDGRCR